MAPDLKGLHVLCVDDNPTNRDILCLQVASWGIVADLAENGPQALRLIRAARECGSPYALAILDMHMPGMDGLALAQAIAADPFTAGLPLIMLTSIGGSGLADSETSHGIAASLTKPVRQSRLHEVIVQVLGYGGVTWFRWPPPRTCRSCAVASWSSTITRSTRG